MQQAGKRVKLERIIVRGLTACDNCPSPIDSMLDPTVVKRVGGGGGSRQKSQKGPRGVKRADPRQ